MPDAAEQLMKFKNAIATPEPPLLGPQRRANTMTAEALSNRLVAFFISEKIPSRIQPLLQGAALLWHDHLDASHNISQGVETRDGSWLHGIMHRREPDYGNAKYWFRRVAPHEAFPKLANRVETFLKEDATGISKSVIENGQWKPFAFIDECERAEQKQDALLSLTLRKIQAAEFDVLVEHIFQSA